MAKTSPRDVLTTQETALDVAGLEALLTQLDTDTAREQAEYERLMALVAPVKERLDSVKARALAVDLLLDEKRKLEQKNAASDQARVRVSNDVAALSANRSQIAQGLATVLDAMAQSSWWGKQLAQIFNTDEWSDEKLVVFGGGLYITIFGRDDGYVVNVGGGGRGNDQLTGLIQRLYAEGRVTKAFDKIAFEVKPTLGSRILAVVGGSIPGESYQGFDANPALAAQIAGLVAPVLKEGTIKFGNGGEIPRPQAQTGASGYDL